MGHLPGVPAPVQELRAAWDRVREAQRAGGIAINLARFDAETDSINQEFLTDYLDILPIKPQFYRGLAPLCSVEDPLNVRAASIFGLVIELSDYEDDKATSLIIGERHYPNDPTLTELLVASWARNVDKVTRMWEDPFTRVGTFLVLRELWQQQRDAALDNVHEPYSHDAMMGAFRSDLHGFVLGVDSTLPLLRCHVLEERFYNISDLKSLKKGLKRKVDNGMHGGGMVWRTLLSSDFTEFEVLPHLEHIAAAFGVGQEFDEVKKAREAKMPAHPIEEMFGLPSYRQTMEQHRE